MKVMYQVDIRQIAEIRRIKTNQRDHQHYAKVIHRLLIHRALQANQYQAPSLLELWVLGKSFNIDPMSDAKKCGTPATTMSHVRLVQPALEKLVSSLVMQDLSENRQHKT
jgi:hypothetical protein